MGLLSFLVGCLVKNPYHKEKGQWYYDDRVINVTSADKFTPLNNRFAKSTQAGYYRGSMIDSSDGASFVAVDDHYAKDKFSVFYCDTYRKGQEYYMMKHNSTHKVANADPTTFAALEQGYAKDSKTVYYEGYAFPVKEVASFQVLNFGFVKDRYTGYFEQTPVTGSDGESFTPLDGHYAKDNKNIFYCFINRDKPNAPRIVTQIVKGVDLATFNTVFDSTGNTDASDKNARYLNGVKLK